MQLSQTYLCLLRCNCPWIIDDTNKDSALIVFDNLVHQLICDSLSTLTSFPDINDKQIVFPKQLVDSQKANHNVIERISTRFYNACKRISFLSHS